MPRHDATFRAGAIALARSEGVKEAAKQLGVHPSLIYKWRKPNGPKPKLKRRPRRQPKPENPNGFVHAQWLEPIGVIAVCPHCGAPILVPGHTITTHKES